MPNHLLLQNKLSALEALPFPCYPFYSCYLCFANVVGKPPKTDQADWAGYVLLCTRLVGCVQGRHTRQVRGAATDGVAAVCVSHATRRLLAAGPL